VETRRTDWPRHFGTSVFCTLFVAGLLVGVAAAQAVAEASVSGSAQVAPAVSLLDQPVSIGISHLPPGQVVTVTVSSADYFGTTWTSQAEFQANGSK
jgi:Acyl-CoA thioester hydrolase/BAAT N-terminal region